MKLLLLAFLLALIAWLAPHNDFGSFVGILAYWVSLVSVVVVIIKHRPTPLEKEVDANETNDGGSTSVAALHETWSKLWHETEIERLEVGDLCQDPWTNMHWPAVNEWVETLPPGQICEMGCGLGQWTRYYALKGRRSVGLDIVPEAIEAAQSESDRKGLAGAEFLVGDARRMPFDAQTFAGISSFGVVEHFMDEDLQAMIDESYRILIRGGRLLLTTPNVWCMHSVTRPLLQALGKWNLGLERSFSPRRLSRYVQRSGFRIVRYGVIESGTLFGDFLTSRIPALETLSRFIERRQSSIGFVSFVIGERV